MSERIILVTNDDGWYSQGINVLANIMKEFGKVIVVAPDSQRSGSGMALNVEKPIKFQKEKSEDNIDYYSCSGTPVDCVKIGVRTIIKKSPDLIVSGINHGSNISCNVLYSGTMGAAIEGCVSGIPSVGFSHMSHELEIDFSWIKKYFREVVIDVLENGLPTNTCLNVNFPDIEEKELKGAIVSRQAEGRWIEEFQKSENGDYFLGGKYESLENGTTDHDVWAIKNNYIAITPIKILLTDKENFESLTNRLNKNYN
jgi:5'-nucleotidase